MRAAELDGEAHATLARLLVLLEIPGELGTVSTDRLVAISCNECPTPELRQTCGCVGNTGFNTDRFLNWADVNLPPIQNRQRHVVFVEESFLVRRVSATVLGRLQGSFGHKHNLKSMRVSVVNARDDAGLEQIMDAHSPMPGGVLHMMAAEAIRLEAYSTTEKPSEPPGREDVKKPPYMMFSKSLFLGDVQEVVAGTAVLEETISSNETQQWARILNIAHGLDKRWSSAVQRVSTNRNRFWYCVAPRDAESYSAGSQEVREAPGEAWRYWHCPKGSSCAAEL